MKTGIESDDLERANNRRAAWCRLIALVAIGALSCVAGWPSEAAEERTACDSLPILERYFETGMAHRESGFVLRLHLIADHHSADCGSPSCYGTTIDLLLRLSPEGDLCRLVSTELQTSDYATEGCFNGDIPRNEFSAELSSAPQDLDLADPKLKRIDFTAETGSKALILLLGNFRYFEDIEPGGILHTDLGPGNEEGCCWGAESAALLHFRSQQED